jgi:hypothetical protein
MAGDAVRSSLGKESLIVQARKRLVPAVLAGVVVATCGGSSPSAPVPAPSATPTPAPTATPAASSNCPPVRWVEGQSYGVKEVPHFLDQLVQVQDRIFAVHPELFAKDASGAPDPAHLKDNGLDTERAYYDYFIEQGRQIPGLCVEYAPDPSGVPNPNNSEEIWIGVAGQPIDAFRVTATTPPAPVIQKYIATNYIKGYGL